MAKKVLSVLVALTLVLSLFPAVTPHSRAAGCTEHTESDENGLCINCGYCVGDHSLTDYYNKGNENGHYLECDNCPYYDPASQSPHTYEDERYTYDGAEGHYFNCDLCEYYDERVGITAHIYSGDDDYICNLCNYNCCLEHNLVWDEKTWEPSDHKLVCQVCGEADNWESHVDGEDEDTLCDVCGFHMTDCTHSDTEGRHDEIDHWRYCHDCGQIIYSKEPHGFTLLYYAERKADGIHLTGSPWDLTVIFAAYTDAGKMIDIQVVENSSDVVTPNVTGEKVTAFFLNSRGMPVHASLSIP